jgi:hypothetical protein
MKLPKSMGKVLKMENGFDFVIPAMELVLSSKIDFLKSRRFYV